MSTISSTLDQTHVEQNSTNNPALNQQAFQRAIAKTSATEREGMAARGAYVKTGLLLLVLIAAAAFGWSQVQVETIRGTQVAITPWWLWLAFLVTFVLGVAGVFAGKAIPLIASGYALAQGALLGVASHFYNLVFGGIVLQAVLLTLALFTVTLILYLTGVIKVTSRLTIGVAIAMGAVALLFLTSWLLSLFGVNFRFLYEPTPLGILLALLIVVLAALNLPLDFEFIKRASASGAPKFMEWYGAFGLMLSIIWMYTSILRLLALTRTVRR
jgi:uncharacterized YccA/Bax inhibitor family protein